VRIFGWRIGGHHPAENHRLGGGRGAGIFSPRRTASASACPDIYERSGWVDVDLAAEALRGRGVLAGDRAAPSPAITCPASGRPAARVRPVPHWRAAAASEGVPVLGITGTRGCPEVLQLTETVRPAGASLSSTSSWLFAGRGSDAAARRWSPV